MKITKTIRLGDYYLLRDGTVIGLQSMTSRTGDTTGPPVLYSADETATNDPC